MVDGEPIGLLLAITFSSHAPVVVTPPAATIPSGGGSLKKKKPLHFSYLDQMNIWRDEILAERARLARTKKEAKNSRREKEVDRLVVELADNLTDLEARLPEEVGVSEPPAWMLDIERGRLAAQRDMSVASLKAQLRIADAIARELEDEEFIFLAVH